MSLRNFRSFTILLVLELAVFESRVDAFTIQRAQETTPFSDVTAAESISLAVKNDLQSLTTKEIAFTNASSADTVPIQTTAKTEEIQKNETDNNATSTTNLTAPMTGASESNDTNTTTTLSTGSYTNDNATSTTNFTTLMPGASELNDTNTTTTLSTGSYTNDDPTSTTNFTTVMSGASESNDTNITTTLSTASDDNPMLQVLKTNSTYLESTESTENATTPISTVAITNYTENTTVTVSNSTVEPTTESTGETTTDRTTTDETTTIETTTDVTTSSLYNEKESGTSENVTTSSLYNEKENGTSEIPASSTISSVIPLNDSIASESNTSVQNVTVLLVNTTGNESINPTTELIEDRRTEENNETSYSTKTVMINESTPITGVDTSSTKDIDGTSQSETSSEIPSTVQMTHSIYSLPTTNVSPLQTSTIEKDTSEKTTVEESTTTEANENNISTEALTGAFSAVTAIPYWKKYTLIERKRVLTKPDNKTVSTEEDDLLKSGTAQTSVTFEKSFTITADIKSLEDLKNALLSVNNTTTSTTLSLKQTANSSTTTLPSKTNTSLDTPSSSSTEPSTEGEYGTTEVPKFDTISSIRAGFLDYSPRSTPVEKEKQTVVQATSPIITLINEIIPVTVTTTPRTTTAKSREVKRITSMTSQSQLAEDAIKEELMKEEILSDSVQNLKRQGEDRFGNKILKIDETTRVQGLELTFPDESNEDKLSVRPISAEKVRNGGLYTVSPNYKPLKKIEVQPPKPFVRDPDDNSWRNESLSSLGIVFKANNSSKPFSEVLKNKTETEWNNLLEKYGKEEGPSELRDRLEKIAEKRKKKKKINQFGETVYTDYEESTSGEVPTSSSIKPETYTRPADDLKYTVPSDWEINKKTTVLQLNTYNAEDVDTTTKKVIDEYEAEDDEPDYTLANIDLKKFMKSGTVAGSAATSKAPPTAPTAPPQTQRTYPPDRQPTIQYFPPLEKQQKVVVNDYDTDFQRKINAFTYNVASKSTKPIPQPIVATHPPFYFPRIKEEKTPNRETRPPVDVNRNVYLTNEDQPEHRYNTPNQDGGYNQASYVIKHLRDFIDEVVKDDEHPLPATEVPSDDAPYGKKSSVKPPSDYYDYEAQFRKDVLDKFVENFNQNSDKYKVDFPILYNTSVVHNTMEDGGRQASSSAFMKRLYEDTHAIQHAGAALGRRPDQHCDRTVELSPAYELHYYVPDEEEKEEIEPKAFAAPYRL